MGSLTFNSCWTSLSLSRGGEGYFSKENSMWLSKLHELHLLWLDELHIHENFEMEYPPLAKRWLGPANSMQLWLTHFFICASRWQVSRTYRENKAGKSSAYPRKMEFHDDHVFISYQQVLIRCNTVSLGKEIANHSVITTEITLLLLNWQFHYLYKTSLQDDEFWCFYFILFYFILFYFILLSFWATPMAYGGSWVRGWIGAVAACLHHSQSHARSEPHLWPTPQLTAVPLP